MHEVCHRCHSELPTRSSGGSTSRSDTGSRAESSSGSDTLLFCPYCSAPQIRFPEHMRIEVQTLPAASTTGTMPPPRPQQIDWRSAMSSAAVVAFAGALLTIVGLRIPAASLVSTLWVMGGAVIALGLYARRQPRPWMDARTGLRVGLVTGLLMICMLGIALASAGVATRFGVHRMNSFDAQIGQQFNLMQMQMTARMQEQHQSLEFQQRVLGFMHSQEVRGGLALIYLGFLGVMILLFSAGGGAFAGMLWSRRLGLRRGV